MSKRILKYQIPFTICEWKLETTQELFQFTPKLFGFQQNIQQTENIPFLWAEQNLDKQSGYLRKFIFQVFGTGDTIPLDMSHFQSIQVGSYVWHLYGKVEEIDSKT